MSADSAILKTLTFFDALGMPLTALEIYSFLLKVEPEQETIRIAEIERRLSDLKNRVGKRDGFYFLAGRESIVGQRRINYRLSLTRYRKARLILKGLRFCPYLEAVAVSGSMALLNARPDSDIDLLIITKKNRIWLTRFLVSLYFQLLGQRRYNAKIAGRFCLNHYIVAGEKINHDRNIYTAMEYANLIPVLGLPVWEKFWIDNSDWLKGFLNMRKTKPKSTFFQIDFSPLKSLAENFLNWTGLGAALNWIVKRYQLSRIVPQDWVSVSDCELSFHPQSKGQRVLSEFRKRLSA